MVRLVNQFRAGNRPGLDLSSRAFVRQVAPQYWIFRPVSGLRGADLLAVARSCSWRNKKLSTAAARTADIIDLLLLQHFQQTRSRRAKRVRIRGYSRRRGAITRAGHWPLGA